MIRFISLGPLQPGAQTTPEHYDVAFVGKPLDDRGPHCLGIARASSDCVVPVEYLAAEPALRIGGSEFRPSDLRGIREAIPARRILLEATSLDVVEMLLLCRAHLQTPDVEIGFIYAEPNSYTPATGGTAGMQTFAFSERCQGSYAVPGFAHELRDDAYGWMVVCVGYESDRLQRMLEEDDGAFINHTTLVFGIPPYRTSWELNALMPHLALFGTHSGLEVAFAGANNPRATFMELKKASEAVAGTVRGQLLIAPLGPKPSGIGVALFAALRDDVRLKYDFPIRIPGGTSGVSTVYRYLVARAN